MSLTKESVAAITGAASGMGRALALRFAREGIAGLAIADVNEEQLAETARLLESFPVNVTMHVVDVADREAMSAFADGVLEQHGRTSHIINNAGVALGGNFREVTLDEIEWLMGINFWGVVYGTKFFLPHLEKEKSAHIVNISSLFGMIAPPGQTAYCASKFAVRGFTEALRHELEGTNIAVSAVHPGGVKTNIVNSARISSGVAMTDKEIENQREFQNKLLAKTSPDEAAEIIFRGMKKRNPQIIVGTDAAVFSRLARLFPRSYLAVGNYIGGGGLKKK